MTSPDQRMHYPLHLLQLQCNGKLLKNRKIKSTNFYVIWVSFYDTTKRGSRGGVRGGGAGPPLEFAKLNIADINGNERISYFSNLCTSTVIRQTESILLKVGPPPLEKFSGSAPATVPISSDREHSKNSLI